MLIMTLTLISECLWITSPSLDICSVASGTLDGFYECGLGLWDISAAAAIAEAAGAQISVLNSKVFPNPFLMVANPALTSELVGLLVECGAVERPKPPYDTTNSGDHSEHPTLV